MGFKKGDWVKKKMPKAFGTKMDMELVTDKPYLVVKGGEDYVNIRNEDGQGDGWVCAFLVPYRMTNADKIRMRREKGK